jgi:hypothetical protein
VKTPIIVVALAVVALTLAPASNPCQAGSVTYEFTEGSGAPNPGEIGATITLESPPASPSSTWTITSSQLSDIINLQIIDRTLFLNGFTGAFVTSSIPVSITSNTGQFIDAGVVLSHTQTQEIEFGTTSTIFEPGADQNIVTGTWTALASVPEPASAVQAGIASAIGLALAAFRKRKEARRQRPVGPLDANQ